MARETRRTGIGWLPLDLWPQGSERSVSRGRKRPKQEEKHGMENGYFRNPGSRTVRTGRAVKVRSPKRMRGGLPAVALLAAGLALAGCKEDCSAAAKLGDFEFSQGNFVNAVKQYEKALKADANCGIVGQKLADAKRRIAEESQGK
jgi:hypothetical protein